MDDGLAGKLCDEPPRQVRGQRGRSVALHLERLVDGILNVLVRKQMLLLKLPQPAVSFGYYSVVILSQNQ